MYHSNQGEVKHKYLKAHSHQFSYLYPSDHEINSKSKLGKRLEILNNKLNSENYPLKDSIGNSHKHIKIGLKEIRWRAWLWLMNKMNMILFNIKNNISVDESIWKPCFFFWELAPTKSFQIWKTITFLF